MRVRQFKLVTGEEIVCEVVEDPKDDDDFILVRNCVTITTFYTGAGNRVHSLRQFMTAQDEEMQIISIYMNHIVSHAIPHKKLLENYRKYVASSPEEVLEPEDLLDSDIENVIKFPGPGRILH